jgi:hypothetical protein
MLPATVVFGLFGNSIFSFPMVESTPCVVVLVALPTMINKKGQKYILPTTIHHIRVVMITEYVRLHFL